MIKRYIGTKVETAAKMLDVSDNIIYAWSNGEVINADLGEQNSFADETIFGKYNDNILNMGHIKLPCGVVNINYLYDDRKTIAFLLDVSQRDISALAYFSKFIITDNIDIYKEGDIINPDERQFLIENGKAAKWNFLTGGSAIEWLLMLRQIDNKGYVLHTLPVLPVRIVCKKENGKWIETSLLKNYQLVLDSIAMYKTVHIQSILRAVPDTVIYDTGRMLQESVDTLINNGRHNMAYPYYDGSPLISFADVLNEIKEPISLYSAAMHFDDSGIIKDTELFGTAIMFDFGKYSVAYDKAFKNDNIEWWRTENDILKWQEITSKEIYDVFYKDAIDKLVDKFYKKYSDKLKTLDLTYPTIEAFGHLVSEVEDGNVEINKEVIKKHMIDILHGLNAYIACYVTRHTK